MRGLLVGFHFCPVLLSGVALFLAAFSSSLHTDLSREEVFERVENLGENSDRMTQKKKTSHNPIPPSAPPPEGSVTFLQYPSLVVNLYTPPPLYSVYTLLTTIDPLKKI